MTIDLVEGCWRCVVSNRNLTEVRQPVTSSIDIGEAQIKAVQAFGTVRQIKVRVGIDHQRSCRRQRDPNRSNLGVWKISPDQGEGWNRSSEITPRLGEARVEADKAVLSSTMQSRLHRKSGSLEQRFTRAIRALSRLVGGRRGLGCRSVIDG